MKYDYDILIIGGGSAGITSALTAIGFGKRVAIVEKDKLGGDCTWSGCIPSKALVKRAKLAKEMHKATDLGFGMCPAARKHWHHGKRKRRHSRCLRT